MQHLLHETENLRLRRCHLEAAAPASHAQAANEIGAHRLVHLRLSFESGNTAEIPSSRSGEARTGRAVLWSARRGCGKRLLHFSTLAAKPTGMAYSFPDKTWMLVVCKMGRAAAGWVCDARS